MKITNFLLLLGTAKCGTTWLGQQMKLHPEFEDCDIKEWRAIKDATKASHNSGRLLSHTDLETISKSQWLTLDREEKRTYARQSLKNYFSIQCSAATWNAETRAVGDITGGNGLATVEQLKLFRENAEALGLTPKPIYMMRDPVSRHLSATKMHFFNNVAKSNPAQRNDLSKLEDYVLSALRDDYFDRRTRYDVLIPKIERVFEKEEILYVFAEDARSPGAIDVFCDFLGLTKFGQEAMPEQQHTKGFVNPIKHDVSEETKQIVRKHYRDVYTFIHDRFGDAVPSQWLTADN